MDNDERSLLANYFTERANAIRQELEAIDELLSELGKPIMDTTPKAQRPTINELNSLKYSDTLNRKNEPYEMTSRSDNQNNAAFQKIQSYIQDHGGFINLHGFKIWVFRDNPDLLGRKPIEKTLKESGAAKAASATAPKKSSLMSYNTSGINFVEKTGISGIYLFASRRDNENNPDFDSLLQTIKTCKENKESCYPFWIFPDGNAIGKNIKK